MEHEVNRRPDTELRETEDLNIQNGNEGSENTWGKRADTNKP